MTYKENSKYEVLTKDGFKDFKGIKKTYREDSIKLYFNDETDIIVTPEHRLLKGSEYIYTKNLSIGDDISGKKITKIEYNVECSNNFSH